MDFLTTEALTNLALFAPVFIVSLTFHEFAHAWAAEKLGDSTARYLGRMTMDPMVHISWFGTVIFPAISVLTGAPLFGWANPVPVDMRNFKKPRQGMALVAAAGPASNLILAMVFTFVLSAILNFSPDWIPKDGEALGLAGASYKMFTMAIAMNLFLAFFNLLPIPPLDGSRVLQGMVGHKMADFLDQNQGRGQMLLLILFIMGALRVLAIPVYLLMGIMFDLAGIPFTKL